eukprot:gene9537-13134_t
MRAASLPLPLLLLLRARPPGASAEELADWKSVDVPISGGAQLLPGEWTLQW